MAEAVESDLNKSDPSAEIDLNKDLSKELSKLNSSSEEEVGYTAYTRVNSMEHLKEVAPDLYKSMLKSLMANMVNQMDRHRKNLKKAMRPYKE